jgi:cobalt/nickel transport protein
MKKTVKTVLIVLGAALGLWLFLLALEGEWAGVDETVIEHVAEQAGRPARDPLINTDQGDILLFVFLVAGAAGGFVAGYQYRRLFAETSEVGQA